MYNASYRPPRPQWFLCRPYATEPFDQMIKDLRLALRQSDAIYCQESESYLLYARDPEQESRRLQQELIEHPFREHYFKLLNTMIEIHTPPQIVIKLNEEQIEEYKKRFKNLSLDKNPSEDPIEAIAKAFIQA